MGLALIKCVLHTVLRPLSHLSTVSSAEIWHFPWVRTMLIYLVYTKTLKTVISHIFQGKVNPVPVLIFPSILVPRMVDVKTPDRFKQQVNCVPHRRQVSGLLMTRWNYSNFLSFMLSFFVLFFPFFFFYLFFFTPNNLNQYLKF